MSESDDESEDESSEDDVDVDVDVQDSDSDEGLTFLENNDGMVYRLFDDHWHWRGVTNSRLIRRMCLE